MAYDTTGATVGAAGHDAATLVAALIGQGLSSNEAILETFVQLRNEILADSLVVQATTALEQGVSAKPAARSYSGGNSSGTPSGKPSGGPAGLDTVIRSGKYGPKDGNGGKTVGEVVEIDRDYAEWAAANMKNEFLQKAFVAGLEAVAA